MYQFELYILLYIEYLFKCHCHNSRQPCTRHAVVTCLRIEYYVFYNENVKYALLPKHCDRSYTMTMKMEIKR